MNRISLTSWVKIHCYIICAADKPGAPKNVRPLEVWADNVLLGWDAPESDGGCPITHYLVECKDVTRRGGGWMKSGEGRDSLWWIAHWD